ncbi:MBL fold metallo-hydrolase [Capnocytophaga granulosa]
MLTLQSFTFNPFSENTYILYGAQGKAFLIDPGCAIHSEQIKLRDFIKEKGLTVEKILLTHAHIDHVFGLQWACDTFALPVHLHPNEQEVLERNPLDARLFGFDFPEFDGDYVFVDEHTILHLEDTPITLRFVPGHSPGSVAFYIESQHKIISGDALFRRSIGRTDLYKGDYNQLLHSIRTQLLSLPDATEVYSGHGAPTTIGEEKRLNPFLQIQ